MSAACGQSGNNRQNRRLHRPPDSDRMCTEIQAYTLRVLHGRLRRPVPELAGLTFEQAGDLIISLRDEMLALPSGAPA